MLGVPGYAQAFTGIVLPAPAKSTLHAKYLSLNDAVYLALRYNPDILNTELDMTTAHFALDLVRNNYLPQIKDLSSSVSTTNFHSFSQGGLGTGVSLKTPLGGSIDVDYHDNLTGNDGRNATITIDQPLLQGFGYKLYKIPLLQARNQLQVTHLANRDTVAGVIVNVVEAYRALIESYQTLSNQIRQTKSNATDLKVARIKFKAGMISRNDMAQSEAAYIDAQYQETQARQSVFNQYQDFLRLLGLNPQAKLEIDKKFHSDIRPIPSYQQALKIAMRNNATYIQDLQEVQSARWGVMQSKDGLRWNLNLDNSTELGHGIGSGADQNENTTTLNWTIPLWNNARLSQHQALVMAHNSLIRAQRNLVEAKYMLAKTITTDLQNIQSDKVTVEQTKRSLQLQERVFYGGQLRWRYGRISTTDLLQLQTTLTNAQQAEINSQISYLNAVSEFYQYLGLTLRHWHIKMRYDD